MNTDQSHSGTLYIKIQNDPNKGNIQIMVQSASGNTNLLDILLPPNQTIEQTFTGLENGPGCWYVVSFQWPPSDFHNLTAGECVIASGTPVTADNAVGPWQIAGKGVSASVPVLLP